MTKRLLVLAPEFIPHPSPAVHRARYVAKHAAAHGWTVEVLAVDPEYHAMPSDPELYELMPEGIDLTQTGALPLAITQRLGVTNTGLIAYPHLRRALRTIIEQRRPSMIYTHGPVFFTFRLAMEARKRFGVPYVLDFTDPWVWRLTDEEQRRRVSKAKLARQLALFLEPETVRHASHVFAVSDGTNREIQERYPDVPASRFTALPFGFEAEDYALLRARPRPNRYWNVDDGNVHFVYAGALLPHATETLEALFDAVTLVREREPGVYRRLRFHFFGTTYDPNAVEGRVMPVARAKGLESIVSEHPRRIPYVDALNVMTTANAVLALGSTEVHYTASKIFPCLLASRPVLALFHEASNVCHTMRAAGTGELVTFGDIERAKDRVPRIADALSRIAVNPGAYPAPNLSGIAEFSVASLMGRLFGILDDLLPEHANEREPVHA